MSESRETYNKRWLEVHTEMSHLMDFPPFSTREDKGDSKFRDDVLAYEFKWNKEWTKAVAEDDTEEIESRTPYGDIIKKWSDDIDEARLYMKRYGATGKGKAEANASVGKEKE